MTPVLCYNNKAMREITIGANDAGQRLDRFLKKYLANAPLSYIYKALRKDVKLNGKRAGQETVLAEGDVLALYLAESELDAFTKQKPRHHAKRQFRVAYEDEDLLAVIKPFGLLVHGDKSEKKNTLANQVTDYLIESGAYVPRLEKSFTPSPVHRLDRNTTGLVVFGKNAASLRLLSQMMQGKGVSKYYYTILCGRLAEALCLRNKLVKDEVRNKVRILPESAEEGLYVETLVQPIASRRGLTFARVLLATGRSHQIRAQLAHAGLPLLGDTKYGGRRTALGTQLLHAARLEITDAPGALERLNGTVITAPIPLDIWNCQEAELFMQEIINER